MPTEPVCPTCGATGVDLRLAGSSRLPASPMIPALVLYSYVCKCGVAFTYQAPTREATKKEP